ncbi:MAG: hypothetical protein ACFFAJ_01325 [Candidatus Hodarchaeota archaeon]
MVITLDALQTQKTVIQTNCPACGKTESIILTESELKVAKEQHSLLTRAISHAKEGHVLTLYIDGEGIVRRKYCFEIAENNRIKFRGSFSKDLKSIFKQMIHNSMEHE